MGRNQKAEGRGGVATPYAVACERVLRYLRLAGFGRDGQRIRIHASKDRGTHWVLTFAVASLEDPAQDFLHASIVAEKATGYLYAVPSRVPQPIDWTDIASIRRGCERITPDDLGRREREEARRVRRPTCFACGSANVHCNGGRCYHVLGLDLEFVEWVHICRNCGKRTSEWISRAGSALECGCPYSECKSVWR